MIVYLMVHFPFVWWWKIGFAHYSVLKRTSALDRAVFGLFIPVGIIIIPFAYPVEQWFHRKFSWFHFRFYKGDGSTETYWFVVAPVVYLVMSIVWLAQFYVAGKCLGFDGVSYFQTFMEWKWMFVCAVWEVLKDWYQFFRGTETPVIAGILDGAANKAGGLMYPVLFVLSALGLWVLNKKPARKPRGKSKATKKTMNKRKAGALVRKALRPALKSKTNNPQPQNLNDIR